QDSVDIGTVGEHAGRGHGVVLANPAKAALAVKKKRGHHDEASPARSARKPACIAVEDIGRCDRTGVAAIGISPIHEPLRTDHQIACYLPVATDVAAAHDTIGVGAALVQPASAGVVVRVTAPSAIAAEVAGGPVRRWRHHDRTIANGGWHVGCERGNSRERRSRDAEQNSMHDCPPAPRLAWALRLIWAILATTTLPIARNSTP